jgi:membrane protease YdiL (CAAX protease family)
MYPETKHMIDSRGRPWGIGATIGFGLIIGVTVVVLQGLLLEGFLWIERATGLDFGVSAMTRNLKVNGFFVAVATLTTSPLCIGCIVLFVRLRRGLLVRDYLGLTVVAPRTMLTWLAILTLFALLSDALTRLLGRPILPEFMVNVYETAYWVPLVWVALVVAAPLFEEVLFRGFLFKGFQHSQLGPFGAVLLTSLAWTALHVQYGAYELGTIFILGIIFGIARLKTRSIYPPLAMHALFNLFAMIQLVAYSGGL